MGEIKTVINFEYTKGKGAKLFCFGEVEAMMAGVAQLLVRTEKQGGPPAELALQLINSMVPTFRENEPTRAVTMATGFKEMMKKTAESEKDSNDNDGE